MNDDIPTHDSNPDAPQPNSPVTQVPPLSVCRKQPLPEADEAKVKLIINATENRDYQALSELAASPGGLIDDEVRRIVCMLKGERCQHLNLRR